MKQLTSYDLENEKAWCGKGIVPLCIKYDKWFYGHLHDNRQVFENNFLLYEHIVRIN